MVRCVVDESVLFRMGETVSVKMIGNSSASKLLSTAEKQQFWREASIHMRLQHHRILRVFGGSLTSVGAIYVTEDVELGSLARVTRRSTSTAAETRLPTQVLAQLVRRSGRYLFDNQIQNSSL